MSDKTLKLLLIEDNEQDKIVFEETIDEINKHSLIDLDIELITVTHKKDAKKYIEDNTFDFIALDLNLPDSTNDETLIDFEVISLDVPIIILTGQQDINFAIKAIQEGYQDYIVKGSYNTDTLARVIRYSVERHKMLKNVKDMALIDELTGLYNRRGFNSVVDKSLNFIKREGVSATLLFADVNKLKFINDNFGHKEGDKVINAVGQILTRSVRKSDVIGRIGGDEFVIFCLKCGMADVKVILDRIKQNYTYYNGINKLPYEISLSIGYVCCNPSENMSIEDIIDKADNLMYKDKKKEN